MTASGCPLPAAVAARVLAVLLAIASSPVGAQGFARDDRFVVGENDDAQSLAVVRNDRIESTSMTVEIVSPPAHGVANVLPVAEGRPTVAFTSDTGYIGPDQFVYRLCAQGACDDATVRLDVRPFAEVRLDVPATAGLAYLPFETVTGRAGLRFVGSPLVRPHLKRFYADVDPTPDDPWNDPPYGQPGATYDVAFLSTPDGVPGGSTDYRFFIDVHDFRSPFHDRLDESGTFYLGLDDDGDGLPSADEVRCAGDRDTGHGCDFEATQVGVEPLAWWVMWHNSQGHPSELTVRAYAVPRIAGGHALAVTGPAHVDDGASVVMALGWRDGTMTWTEETSTDPPQDLAYRAGVVDVYDGDALIGAFPVHLRKLESGTVHAPVPLVSGRPERVGLERWREHRHLFIDVPDGATSLQVIARSASTASVTLRGPATTPADPAMTAVPAASGPNVAAVSTDGGEDRFVVRPPVLKPGRWYVVPVSGTAQVVEITATVAGSAPALRPGSYFNPARPGSGIFLYPAADQLTGLWYTYDRFGLPTWYYLQAAQPGPDGVWRSAIHRATWNGVSRALTEVGELVLTPSGPDAFVSSYVIDGATGSQPLQALGRGCPVLDGAPLDVSSTWFDPAKPGTGYSVQTWPDYEYYAAYLYDASGQPRFVAAESATFAGDTATLVVQQLLGACPTCVHVAPVRTDIGLLTREVGGGTLDAIGIDLEFESPLAGGWIADDDVVPLGGPDSTQGCDP